MMQNLIYTSTCKAAINIKNKKGAWNKCVKWLSFQTKCLWVPFVSGLSCSTERDWSVHFNAFNALHTFFCWSIQASFVEFVLFLYSLWNWITKAKFIFLCKGEMQLNTKSMKMGWIRKVKLMIYSLDDCWKFQYHSLTQTILEMTQFKMPCGSHIWPSLTNF